MSKWVNMTEDQRQKKLANARRWHLENLDRARERNRKWRAANKAQHNEAGRIWYQNNKERAKVTRRKYREKHPDYFQEKHLKNKYGITVEQRNAIFSDQGNVCACCGSNDPRGKTGWIVDHCHATSKIRGIVCFACNVTLGQVNDNIETLVKMITYLRKHQ